MTVTEGKANVGVGVMVGEGVMLGVKVTVGVNVIVAVGVEVNIAVGVGVSVHAAAVAVMEIEVMVVCISGDGPQADRMSRRNIELKTGFIFSRSPDMMWRVYVMEKGLSIGKKEALQNARLHSRNGQSNCPSV